MTSTKSLYVFSTDETILSLNYIVHVSHNVSLISNNSNSQLVESRDSEPADTEGWL